MPAKTRRKGPAHQNTFAFKHNPNSKLTAKILSLPNEHVCRRCHEKIEWRKQYRKYKPRTQPGKCTCCQMKRVTAAYHTICEPCTRQSSKAKKLLEEWNTMGPPTTSTVAEHDDQDENTKGEGTEENDKNESKEQPVVIFKHSTRCSISSMAFDRLRRAWKEGENVKPYYLDLIQYRDISNQIAERFGIMHQSPQVILLKDGKAIYDNSHMGISYQDLISHANVS